MARACDKQAAFRPGVNCFTGRSASSGATTYTYDAANQIVRSQSGATLTTYAYDNAGNRRLLQTTSRTTYVWDDENRMVSSQPAIATNYTYDPDNLRVTASNTSSRHIWDGQNAIEERDSSSNAIQVAYTLEPLLYGNLISQRRSGASSYYLFDALGNVVNLTDSAQNKPNSYTYPGAYGNFSLQVSGTALNNNLIFVGRQGYYASNPPFNALIYIRNRWYDPSTANWMSPDPLGFGGGDWNVYRYVKNNPVNTADPSGMQAPFFPPRADAEFQECINAAIRQRAVSGGQAVFTFAACAAFCIRYAPGWFRIPCLAACAGVGYVLIQRSEREFQRAVEQCNIELAQRLQKQQPKPAPAPCPGA